MENKMTTYLTEQEEIKDNIKQVGYFMYFCTVIQTFMAYIDPFYAIDAILCGYLGYRACNKPAKGIMVWIASYYGLSILLSIDEGSMTATSIGIKAVIMFWLATTTIKAFKHLKVQKLIPSTI